MGLPNILEGIIPRLRRNIGMPDEETQGVSSDYTASARLPIMPENDAGFQPRRTDMPEIPLGGNQIDTSQYQPPAQPLMDGIAPDLSRFQPYTGGEPSPETMQAEMALHPRSVSSAVGGLPVPNNTTANIYEGIAPTTRNPEDEPNLNRRIGRLETEGASKNKWWKRMLQGALRGLGAGGLGGAILGATIEGVSPRINTKIKTAGYLGEANTRVAEQTARRKAEQDAAKRGFEIQGEQAETAKKVLQAVQQRNPVLWEAIKQKGFIDTNDQAAIQQAGYGYVPTGSWFQTETTYDKDGNLLWTPKTGTPNYQPTGIQDPKQGTSIYKGRPMKPSEAGRLETDEQQFNVRELNDIAAKNAQMQADVARRNIDRDVDYNNRALSVLQKIAESDAAILSANPQMQGYAQSMQVASAKAAAAAQAGDTEAFAAAQAEFDAANENFGKALGNIQGNQKLAAEYRKTIGKRPPKEVFKPISAATVPASTGRTTESTARSYLSSKGLKGKALEDAVRAGKAAGEIY